MFAVRYCKMNDVRVYTAEIEAENLTHAKILANGKFWEVVAVYPMV